MFDPSERGSFDQIASFLSGDREVCPFTSWIHYAQTAYVGIIVSTFLFCGTSAGG